MLKEVEPSIWRAHDEEMKFRQLAVYLLSEVKEVKVASQREKNRLLHSLEAVHTEWIEDQKKQQEVVNLFKKLKYHQRYKDGVQGNTSRHPLKMKDLI